MRPDSFPEGCRKMSDEAMYQGCAAASHSSSCSCLPRPPPPPPQTLVLRAKPGIALPSMQTLPTISGTPAVGHTLTASTGSWLRQVKSATSGCAANPSGASCQKIGGATSDKCAPTRSTWDRHNRLCHRNESIRRFHRHVNGDGRSRARSTECVSGSTPDPARRSFQRRPFGRCLGSVDVQADWLRLRRRNA